MPGGVKRLLLYLTGGVCLASAASPIYVIDTVAGGGQPGDGGQAVEARLGAVEGLAIDALGNLYIADSLDHRIRRVDRATGVIETLAGDGFAGLGGDGGAAAQARLNQPYGLAVGPDGSLYVADFGNRSIRRIRPEGTIETVAGGGAVSSPEAVRFAGPRNVALGAGGAIYVSDFLGHRVYLVHPSGRVEVIAGTGVAGFNGDGPALGAELNAPAGLALGPDGSLYIADSGNRLVRRLRDGRIETVAGNEEEGLRLEQPTGVAVDGAGTLYIADGGALLAVDPAGGVSTLARAPAGSRFRDVAVAPGGLLYAGGGRRVWAIPAPDALAPAAGNGEFGNYADGVPATAATLDAPIAIALDAFGDLLIADEGRRRVRRVQSDGRILTIAGNGEAEAGGDGGPASEAGLGDPVSVAADPLGGFWIADYRGHRVRRVLADGTILTVAGDGQPGYTGDGGPAAGARLNLPRAVAADGFGNLFIADSGNHCVRRVGPDGTIETYAGNGVQGYGGDLGLARLAYLDSPAGLAVDREGGLYVADAGSHTVRYVRPDGIILTVAGTGAAGYTGDGGPAAQAQLNRPSAVAVAADRSLLIADTGNHRVRRVSPDGVIETVAGTGAPGFSGDGGPAAQAQLSSPSSLAIGPEATVLIADLGNRRVRRLRRAEAAPVIQPVGRCEVVNGASFQPGPVAPGEIVAVFAAGAGPPEPVAGELDADGRLKTALAGVEVRFDGVLSPIFYAGRDQLNVQVPYEAAGREELLVEVFSGGRLHSRAQVSVAEAAPGLFTLEGGAGQAAAVNEDGTVNSEANPAPKGSIVLLYATGEGLLHPPAETGRPAVAPLGRPEAPVHVRIAGLPAEVLYAGAAPGLVGVMQLNVRVPGGFAPSGRLAVELWVGERAAQPGVYVWVR